MKEICAAPARDANVRIVNSRKMRFNAPPAILYDRMVSRVYARRRAAAIQGKVRPLFVDAAPAPAVAQFVISMAGCIADNS
jgi:hypothetical protein